MGRSRARRDQLISLGLMALFLACIVAYQPLLTRMREGQSDAQGRVERPGIVPPPPTSGLAQMAAEFPRLTLGGFRGLLTPFLWQQAEENKNERRWQDLNTTYNIIGKLQPYFIGVYSFNAWNQAYNLSAQWHSIDEKYLWVLEGQAYLYEGERFNPGNPDILWEIGQMYFSKLGNAFERIEYREKWRNSIAHQYELGKIKDAQSKVQEAHQRVHDLILRPQFRLELREDPENPANRGYGVRIWGLKPTVGGKEEPVEFPYGLSPFYFAYVEYQRCRAAGPTTMVGSNVTDAYPAMALRMWCRDDTYYSQSKCREMFYQSRDGSPAPERIKDFDRLVDDVRLCYRNIDMVEPQALDLFAQHLGRYPGNHSVHDKHVLETQFIQKIAWAEHELFEGLVLYYLGEHSQMRVITPAARQRLQASLPKYEQAIGSVQEYLDKSFPIRPGMIPPEERADFDKYLNALRQRIEGVRAMLAASPGERLDFSFLMPDTVER